MQKILFLVATVSWAWLTLYLTTLPNLVVSEDTALSLILSNGAHFGFFGIQAGLLYFTFSRKYFLASVTLTSLFGLWIEYLQIHIPGRSFSYEDWLLDTLGAILFVVIIKKLFPSYTKKGKKKI